MNPQDNDVLEIDLLEVMKALKKRAWIIILVSLLTAGAAGAYAFYYATPIYESTAKMYITTQSTSITSLADIQVGSSLAYDYREMIISRKFLTELKYNLGLDYSYNQMKNMITVENPSNTRILNISVKSPDSEEAKNMANELAQISKVNISDIMKTDEPAFYEKAIKTTEPVEPEKIKLIMIGFLIGFLLSAGLVIIRHVLNDKFSSAEDIERTLGLPVLTTLPIVKTGTNKNRELKKRNKKSKQEMQTGERR